MRPLYRGFLVFLQEWPYYITKAVCYKANVFNIPYLPWLLGRHNCQGLPRGTRDSRVPSDNAPLGSRGSDVSYVDHPPSLLLPCDLQLGEL